MNPRPRQPVGSVTTPRIAGHGTYLPHGQLLDCYRNIPIEVCITSNVLSRSVSELEQHHIADLLRHGHPFAICTDDKGARSDAPGLPTYTHAA